MVVMTRVGKDIRDQTTLNIKIKLAPLITTIGEAIEILLTAITKLTFLCDEREWVFMKWVSFFPR